MPNSTSYGYNEYNIQFLNLYHNFNHLILSVLFDKVIYGSSILTLNSNLINVLVSYHKLNTASFINSKQHKLGTAFSTLFDIFIFILSNALTIL